MDPSKKHITKHLISAFVFFITVASVMVIMLFLPDKSYSDQERRYLQQKPELSVKNVISGKFSSETEKYINDQFPVRNLFVSVKTMSDYTLGKKETKGIIFAKDHYLIEGMDSYDEEKFSKNLDYTVSFTDTASETGVNCTFMLVPTASSILSEKMPANIPQTDQHQLIREACEKTDSAVDIYDGLYAHRNEYIFYRNDHHWTSLGAYYAYNAFCKNNGIIPAGIDNYEKSDITDRFLGTTYLRSNFFFANPDTITAFSSGHVSDVIYNFTDDSHGFYEMPYADSSDPYSVFLNGNQPFTQIKTDVKNSRNLMIIKDSYANTFAQFVTGDFENIYLIDLRFFKTNPFPYLSEFNITDILILYNVKNFTEDNNLFYLKC